MSETVETGRASCHNCGKPLHGAYCSHCGTRAEAPQEGWGVIASELFDSQESRTHASTLASFLKAPAATIIRLTEDPGYRKHWTFLSIALGVQFTLAFLILPHFLAPYFAVPDPGGKSALIATQLSQYLGIAILTPIQYYICRAAGSIARTPASYVKLCVLSVSYCSILSTLITVFFWVSGAAATALHAPPNAPLYGAGLTALLQLAILVFVTITHKRFWGMRWWVAILVTLLIAVLSWVVVYPLLFNFVSASGVVKTIDDLFP